MYKDIHILNIKKGGVWEIVQRLESKNATYALTSARTFFMLLRGSYERIYFHQPKSHLFSILILPFFNRNKIYCVLHETSDYNNLGDMRSIFKSLARRIVIKILEISRINFLAVSDFVTSSYGLKRIEKVSYLHLFNMELMAFTKRIYPMNNCNSKNGCIVWLRLGTSKWTVNIIKQLEKQVKIDLITILGDKTEINILKSMLIFNRIDIPYVTPGILHKIDFLNELWTNKWFISGYRKEGFGLSIYEALWMRSICLVPKSGALVEWVPEHNFKVTYHVEKGIKLNSTQFEKVISENILFLENYEQN
jgi:hypothetical protein